MIVIDASTFVSAAFRQGSVPDLAVRHVLQTDQIALSASVMAEYLDVLHRPRLERFIDPALRVDLLRQIKAGGAFFSPTVIVADCRDAKDNRYLELALAANAATIVSSDDGLLVLHPWRGVRIFLPAAYLAEAVGSG